MSSLLEEVVRLNTNAASLPQLIAPPSFIARTSVPTPAPRRTLGVRSRLGLNAWRTIRRSSRGGRRRRRATNVLQPRAPGSRSTARTALRMNSVSETPDDTAGLPCAVAHRIATATLGAPSRGRLVEPRDKSSATSATAPSPEPVGLCGAHGSGGSIPPGASAPRAPTPRSRWRARRSVRSPSAWAEMRWRTTPN